MISASQHVITNIPQTLLATCDSTNWSFSFSPGVGQLVFSSSSFPQIILVNKYAKLIPNKGANIAIKQPIVIHFAMSIILSYAIRWMSIEKASCV